MIKKNKLALILSSIIILIPMVIGLLLWNKLPETLPMHWNAAGEVDGYSGRGMAVFFLPLFMLGMHWFCILMTSLDPKSKDIGGKTVHLVIWICPFMSLLTNSFVYSTALGYELSVNSIMPLFLGLMFLIIGNYLPKCKRNYTIGIKVSWALEDDGNWTATHRFAGKVWVIGGAVIMATAFLGYFIIFIGITMVMALAPILYSYLYYRNHEKEKKDGN